MSKKILGVIPARGGSKRFPRKNISLLNGKPLIYYSIEAARSSRYLTDYVFSTDDKEILDIALNIGACAPFVRPLELGGDSVRNSATMIHALHYMENLNKIEYDYIVLLQPTSPLRDQYHIDEAISIFTKSNCTTLASVKGPYKKRDINLKKIVDGNLKNLISENEPYYMYNAAIYIVKREWLLKKNRFNSENELAYIMDDLSSIDVDNELDLILAQAALEYKELQDEKI